MSIPFLAPKITIPTSGTQRTFIFPRGPEWYSYPYAGRPYIGRKPPPPLFSISRSGEKAESLFSTPYITNLGYLADEDYWLRP